MSVENYIFYQETQGFTDIIDITTQIRKIIDGCSISNGTVLVFCPGSTAGITTTEYESGCLQDLKDFFERVAPVNGEYTHNLRWGDGNGYAHLRSSVIKPSFSFPVIDGEAILGTWQQIIFIDFDNKGRNRKIYVQVCGE